MTNMKKNVTINGINYRLCGNIYIPEGVPDPPVAPQDEAGLTTTFQTWPRGCFHIPKDPDFPVPS